MKSPHLDRRSKYSQMMIRSALFQLLQEKDLDSITVTDICKLADINRGTFYKYYRDVGDLFYKLEKNFTEELHELFKESETVNFDMEEFLQKTLHVISENKEFMHMIQQGKRTSRLVQDILSVIEPYSLQIIRKEYPGIGPEEMHYLFEYRLGGITNMIVKWVNDDMNVPISRMKDMILYFTTAR